MGLNRRLHAHRGTGLALAQRVAPHDSPEIPELETRPSERRDRMRVDVLGQVEAHSVWRLRPIFLRELSSTGFSVEATGPFVIGTTYKFRLTVEGHRLSVIVQARAMHCSLLSVVMDLPIYLAGFEIVNASQATTREVQALLRFAESLWREETEP